MELRKLLQDLCQEKKSHEGRLGTQGLFQKDLSKFSIVSYSAFWSFGFTFLFFFPSKSVRQSCPSCFFSSSFFAVSSPETGSVVQQNGLSPPKRTPHYGSQRPGGVSVGKKESLQKSPRESFHSNLSAKNWQNHFSFNWCIQIHAPGESTGTRSSPTLADQVKRIIWKMLSFSFTLFFASYSLCPCERPEYCWHPVSIRTSSN